LEFFVFQIDGNDFREARDLERLDTEQTDHARAYDDDRSTDASWSSVCGVDCDRDGFDHRGVFKRE
jgi:hypothetical protein